MTQPTLSKIVVGVDGSPQSERALTWACNLAEHHLPNVTVEALCASTHPISPLAPVLGASKVPVDALSREPRHRLHALVGTVETRTPVVETVVLRSAMFALEQASRTADLIALGPTGRGRLENLLRGSTTNYCVHTCRCPVAIVRNHIVDAEVIVAVDGSENSIGALRWALSIWPASQLRAVYSHDESALDDLRLDDDRRGGFEERARDLLDQSVSQACNGLNIEASAIASAVRAGDPRTTIVDTLPPDGTLILGTQGHSGIARWMLGSLADYAVGHAPGNAIIWR